MLFQYIMIQKLKSIIQELIAENDNDDPKSK